MIIQGYAFKFDELDHHYDVIKRGALSEIHGNKVGLDIRHCEDVWMFGMHDQKQKIGYWMELEIDSAGLLVTGKVYQKFEKFANQMDGLSIGFKTIDDIRTVSCGHVIRNILKLDLWEISLVTRPSIASCRYREVN